MSSYCILCSQVIHDDFETHINERHSSPESKVRDVDGKSVEMTDAEWVRANASGPVAGGGEDNPMTVVPIPSIFDSLGIRAQDLENAEPEVIAGASCTEAEAKKVFEAVEAHVGYKMDRAHFLVSFLDWGIRTSFSEELAEAGGWTIKSAVTVGNKSGFYRAQDLHSTIRDFLGESATGRDFTFRRLGRTFAARIPDLVAKNKSLAKYSRTGSDISNRLGVPPSCFLACTSIFESVKPFAKWSDDELKAWQAHNSSVRKEARDSRRRPEDLRPAPEQAQGFRDSGYDDWAQRVVDRYGKGGEMFNKMWSPEGKRSPGDNRGLGA